MRKCVYLSIPLPLAPEAPTGVTGAALDFNALRVTWTPPSVPNGVITDHLVSYSIHYVHEHRVHTPAASLHGVSTRQATRELTMDV